MDSNADEMKAPASLAMVDHEGGGVFSFATTDKGIQGDRGWLATRAPNDIDNCDSTSAMSQVKSDQETPIVVLQEEVR